MTSTKTTTHQDCSCARPVKFSQRKVHDPTCDECEGETQNGKANKLRHVVHCLTFRAGLRKTTGLYHSFSRATISLIDHSSWSHSRPRRESESGHYIPYNMLSSLLAVPCCIDSST